MKKQKAITHQVDAVVMQNAFDFFEEAAPEDIKTLGWRIGEKNDLMFSDDFINEIIAPFITGIVKGSHHKFENPISIKIA